MPGQTILKTRLHRPRLSRDHIRREALLDLLTQGIDKPLSLVSASAGYGKSTLISSWLNTLDISSAWISLDAAADDAVIFGRYLVAAVQQMFPGALNETQKLLNAPEPVPLNTITESLVNELYQIEQSFVLVVDDYHHLEQQPVHDLVTQLLEHPLWNMQLIIITRHDPPLPLHQYRSKGTINEIRVPQLSFSKKETRDFFRETIDAKLSKSTIIELYEKSEGWPAALRMLSLTDPVKLLEGQSQGKKFTTHFLVKEVLDQCPENVREFLLKISVLDQFCDSIGQDLVKCSPQEVSSQMDYLKSNDLFLVALDDHNEWFRFHHLFQEMLQIQLEADYTETEILELYALAGNWFAENGQPENSIKYLLKSGDPDQALAVFKNYRQSLLNRLDWPVFERIIEVLPADTDPEMVLSRAWTLFYQGHREVLWKLITTIDQGSLKDHRLNGELNTFLSYWHYTGDQVDFHKSLQHADMALEHADKEFSYLRGLAWVFWGAAHLALNKTQEALEKVHRQLGTEPHAGERLYMLMTLNYLHWLSGDLNQLRLNAVYYEKTARELKYPDKRYPALLFQAHRWYLMNKPDHCILQLERAYHNRYLMLGTHHLATACTMALAYFEQGATEKAFNIVSEMGAYALAKSNPSFLLVHGALQAELYWRNGEEAKAFNWAEKVKIENLVTITDFYYHYFTLIKLWIYQGTPQNLEKAAKLLKRTAGYFRQFNYLPHLCENLALEALLWNANQNDQLALEKLKEALAMAAVGGGIRFFTDLGPKMGLLMQMIIKEAPNHDYYPRVLQSFRSGSVLVTPENQEHLLQLLTSRENQVLDLLATQSSNKEIAQELFISYETVKRHTKNIYRKLEVPDRRSALIKARKLGLIAIA